MRGTVIKTTGSLYDVKSENGDDLKCLVTLVIWGPNVISDRLIYVKCHSLLSADAGNIVGSQRAQDPSGVANLLGAF